MSNSHWISLSGSVPSQQQLCDWAALDVSSPWFGTHWICYRQTWSVLGSQAENVTLCYQNLLFLLDTHALHTVKYPEDVLSSGQITFLCMHWAQKEKCGFREEKSTWISVVDKHRSLSMKTEVSILAELSVGRTEMNVFIWEQFTCNSDCTRQKILLEVSSGKEIKQRLGMCLSIDLIILLNLW